ncbi:replication initiation factor domain-containing protein [Anaerolineales bacterium HSG6]|nr:replication initiation factor domain-containing protein [Anaerolineales bacterium HSG6]
MVLPPIKELYDNNGKLLPTARFGEFFIDYYRFTTLFGEDMSGCPSIRTVADLAVQIAGSLGGGVPRPSSGGAGYTSALIVAGTGFVAFNVNEPSMGVRVELGAQALTTLAKMGIDPAERLEAFRDMGFELRCKRIDIATDRNVSILDKVTNCRKNWHFTSRAKKGKVIESWDKAQKELAKTEYFGTQNSACMIRIYDKLQQYAHKGIELPYEVWERAEAQFNKEAADNVYGLVRSKLWLEVRQCILGRLEFKIFNPDDSNLSRWETCKWWTGIFETTKKMTIGLTQSKSSLAGTMNWINDSVAGTLSLIAEAYELTEAQLGALVLKLGEGKGSDRLKVLLGLMDDDDTPKEALYVKEQILKQLDGYAYKVGGQIWSEVKDCLEITDELEVYPVDLLNTAKELADKIYANLVERGVVLQGNG